MNAAGRGRRRALLMRQSVGLAVLIAFAIALPTLVSNTTLYFATVAIVMAIGALSLTLLAGAGGQFSLGHAAFFAVGSYGVTWLVNVAGLPYVLATVAIAIIGGLLGFAVAVPVARFQGLYLAVATLAMGEVVVALLTVWPFTGGYLGFRVVRPAIGDFVARSDRAMYYVVLAVAIAAAVIVFNLIHSRFGRALGAVRVSETVAASIGVNGPRTKEVAFGISAGIATVGGVLYGGLLTTVTVENYRVMLSLAFVFAMFVGGARSVIGAFVGAAFFIGMPEVLRRVDFVAEAPSLPSVIFGVTFLLVFIYLPDGLVPTIARRLKRATEDSAEVRKRTPDDGAGSASVQASSATEPAVSDEAR